VLGIAPAAGAGTRLQPLAFSKEVLPVGSRRDNEGVERPKAVSEFLVERMLAAGADRICFVISPEKTDIVEYYAKHPECERFCYVVQERPRGLCDALFRPGGLVRDDEEVLIGLPDTVWFPKDGFRLLPPDELALLLFPVDRPELFDAVLATPEGAVTEVRVKSADPGTKWVWGALRLPGRVYHELRDLWLAPQRRDEYLGTLINAYLSRGGRAIACPRGERYYDIGTLEGYRAAVASLAGDDRAA
jgi:dTDP-glucose pyrophosphorylase